MQLRIAYLYPDLMNIYGDRGNIIVFQQRCLWRGIEAKVTPVSLGGSLNPHEFDLFFGGGGQDRQQLLVSQDLQKKKAALQKAVDSGKVFLLICGTYQLFGHYFLTSDDTKIPGLGILDLITKANPQRKIGNILVKLSPEIILSPNTKYEIRNTNLVGFENHSGNTFIAQNSSTKPLGVVIRGFGNNGQDKTEGAVYQHVYGTYLHGSLLPKNPHFADYLIQTALENRYQKPISLKPLNNHLEWQAHQFVVKYRV